MDNNSYVAVLDLTNQGSQTVKKDTIWVECKLFKQVHSFVVGVSWRTKLEHARWDKYYYNARIHQSYQQYCNLLSVKCILTH